MRPHYSCCSHPSMLKHTQGFTIIEILVAIALLGILTAVLTSMLTGTLTLNRSSQTQLEKTSKAQQVIESIRGSWEAVGGSNFDRICVQNYTPPAGFTATWQNLDSRANIITGAGSGSGNVLFISGNTPLCSSKSVTATTPVMRRVTVTSGTSGEQNITLVLDVLRPQ